VEEKEELLINIELSGKGLLNYFLVAGIHSLYNKKMSIE
jgi:hypothetical protein